MLSSSSPFGAVMEPSTYLLEPIPELFADPRQYISVQRQSIPEDLLWNDGENHLVSACHLRIQVKTSIIAH